MYRVEKRVYMWEGNYFRPTKESYEWQDIAVEFESEEKALQYIEKIMATTLAENHRIVHNGQVIATYKCWQGKAVVI